MKTIAGFFRTSEAADAAMGDLQLRGFTHARIEPWPPGKYPPEAADNAAAAPPEGDTLPARVPAGAQPLADLDADGGAIPLGGWSQNSAGWVLFNAFKISEQQHAEYSELGAVFVVVEEVGEQEAVLRSILERNGAEDVRLVG